MIYSSTGVHQFLRQPPLIHALHWSCLQDEMYMFPGAVLGEPGNLNYLLHSLTQQRTQTHRHTDTKRAHARTHPHMHRHTYTERHTRARARSHTHAQTHIHAHTHMKIESNLEKSALRYVLLVESYYWLTHSDLLKCLAY